MTTLNVSEGYVAFPRRLSLAIAISFALALVSQTAGLSWYAAKLDSRIAELEQADRRLAARGDERFHAILMRIEVLERDRDRLARLEERVTTATELLREIRQEVRRR
ncbi:hypothetical protein [Enterovirga rhinocerotis]|uniref:Uncharacterized protein n=1 Tax=Enterovirga rhinocerotis TaxID=1339210 RepID=A0A4R7CBS2_9HYPH|nr:hypothetical protein [Enterovirga rhinocerotis]TDR94217.1 hypothetical protein EV668_1497 [Enterovirga rhinocerotis]